MNVFDFSGQECGYNECQHSSCRIVGLHDGRIRPAYIFFCKVLRTVQPQLEGTGACESDQDHGDGLEREMGMLQAVDQTLFFAGCFLVSIWQREQEYQYKKYDIRNSASIVATPGAL